MKIKDLVRDSSLIIKIVDAYKGILWILIWTFSFSLAMVFTRLVSQDIPTGLLVFIRTFFGLIFFIPFSFKLSTLKFNIKLTPIYCLRACLTSAAMLCTYYTYAHLPLATAAAIGFTGPLFTCVLSSFFLKERINTRLWLIILLGYSGVLIILRPENIIFSLTILVAIVGNILTSCAIITTKYLSRTETTNRIVFYTNLLSLFILGLASFKLWQVPNIEDLKLIFILGGLGVFSQFCYAQAIKYSNVSALSPFEYTRLVFAIFFGFFIFNETPSFLTLAGSLIIIVANFYLAFSDSERKKAMG